MLPFVASRDPTGSDCCIVICHKKFVGIRIALFYKVSNLFRQYPIPHRREAFGDVNEADKNC